MKRRPQLTRRNRLRLTLLAVLALLFQQMAFAAYACSPMDMPQGNVAMSMHCQGMPMAQRKAPMQGASAMCVQHCSRQVASTRDAKLPNVPPLLTPALLPAQPTLVALPVFRTAHEWSATVQTRGIPPALRYRVLLI